MCGGTDETPRKRSPDSKQACTALLPLATPYLCVSMSIFIMFLPLPQHLFLTAPSRPVTTKIKMVEDPSRKAVHGKGRGTDLNSFATPKHTPGLSSFGGGKKWAFPKRYIVRVHV